MPIRVSHFGKKFEFSSVNPGSHSNRYIRKVSSFSEFLSNIYYSPIDLPILLYIFALREDLICQFSITYSLRYQGDRVLFRLFCTIYQSGMLVYILNEIATLWVISRVSHFGKKFEFSSVNPGSHSNRYIRKVS